MTSEFLEDVESLLANPGWLRLKAWAEHEWKDRIIEHTVAVADAPDDKNKLALLQQIIAGHRTAEMILKWPEEQIAKCKQQAMQQTTTTVGRGGYR